MTQPPVLDANLKADLLNRLSELTTRQAVFVLLRFGLISGRQPMTFAAIAREFGCREETVSKTVRRALRQMGVTLEASNADQD